MYLMVYIESDDISHITTLKHFMNAVVFYHILGIPKKVFIIRKTGSLKFI